MVTQLRTRQRLESVHLPSQSLNPTTLLSPANAKKLWLKDKKQNKAKIQMNQREKSCRLRERERNERKVGCSPHRNGGEEIKEISK